MSQIFLNPNTEKVIDAVRQNLPQALLISGPKGMGLSTIASIVAKGAEQITLSPEKDDKVNLSDGIINVDMIRDLYKNSYSKSTKKVVFLIKNAETMTVQAQNAFLKLLEEPVESVNFILLSHNDTKLLPTIISRVQQLKVHPITPDQSSQLLDSLGEKDQLKRNQIQFLVDGLPAAITQLATDETLFKARTTITYDARQILQSNHYQRLKIIQKYKDNRPKALLLLDDFIAILRRTLSSSKSQSSNILVKIDDALKTYENIEQNGNIRLNLAKLVL